MKQKFSFLIMLLLLLDARGQGTPTISKGFSAQITPAATTMQNAAVANGNGTSLSVQGYTAAVIDVTASVAMSGGTTINFEASPDDTLGTPTWVAIVGNQVGTSNLVSTTTTTGVFRFYVSGFKALRARISSYSAGTITVRGYTIPVGGGPQTVQVANTVTATVSGTVNMADGAGNAVTSNSTTIASKRYLDMNVLTFAGTLASIGDLNNASSIAGVLDVGPVARYDSTPPTLTTGRWNFLQEDSRGSLNIAKGPAGFSIDNTSFAATESGTWTVQPGNTANTTPWLVKPHDGTNPMFTASNPGYSKSNDGDFVTIGAKTDAKSTATDGTSTSVVSILKEISAMEQAPASRQVTNAGTFAVQAAGDVPSGSSDSGNPMKQGYVGKTALPSPVSDGQRVNGIADKFGRQIMLPQAPRDLIKPVSVQTTNTTQTNLLAAQGVGVFADLISLTVTTESGTATTVSLSDGTTTYKIEIPATVGQGAHLAWPVPIPATSSNTAWTVTSSATVTLDFIAEFILNR